MPSALFIFIVSYLLLVTSYPLLVTTLFNSPIASLAPPLCCQIKLPLTIAFTPASTAFFAFWGKDWTPGKFALSRSEEVFLLLFDAFQVLNKFESEKTKRAAAIAKSRDDVDSMPNFS